MYESIPQSLVVFAWFIIAGFVLAILYEPLRIIRQIIYHKTIAYIIEDTVFFAFCAFLTFIFSLEFGVGSVRAYYVFAEIIGAAIYFLTVGNIFKIIYTFVCRIAKKIISKVINVVANNVTKLFRFFVKHIQKNSSFM